MFRKIGIALTTTQHIYDDRQTTTTLYQTEAHTVLHRSIATHTNNGAHNRIWTGDLFLTKEVLYRLSYMSADSSTAVLQQHH